MIILELLGIILLGCLALCALYYGMIAVAIIIMIIGSNIWDIINNALFGRREKKTPKDKEVHSPAPQRPERAKPSRVRENLKDKGIHSSISQRPERTMLPRVGESLKDKEIDSPVPQRPKRIKPSGAEKRTHRGEKSYEETPMMVKKRKEKARKNNVVKFPYHKRKR